MRGDDKSLGFVAAAACAAGAAAWVVWSRRRSEDEEDEIGRLVRPNIRRLAPYRCARDDYEEGVLLDANENAFGPAAAAPGLEGIHRYPDPGARQVKARIAALRGVRPEQIFVGVGSDEAIDLLFRVFCEPRQSTVLIMPPTYGMYKVCAAANDVGVLSAPLDESFDVDVPTSVRVARGSTRLVFVTSPGNPTARIVSRDRVVALHRLLPRAIIVVDEAYVDFREDATLAKLVDDFPRLVVLQTLSKAFGLAGARVGTAIASERVVGFLNNLKAPYNVNKMTAALAAAALDAKGVQAMRANVVKLNAEKAILRKGLLEKPYVTKIFPSDANFLLVQITPPQAAKPLYKTLAENGVVVRYRGDQLNCAGCLRVTVGTPPENKALLDLLDTLAPALIASHQNN
ncbi:hypothetical protein CTAYLR_003096 [Chrysophaeum taylorii]|uniref:histidinol-phosphate transaminase n=1 Tax=Chrysophaeum taylorii TaxID=2483200 RepID=A0AAD7U5K1_9STRA|nr:hypothetical protein CTAYLR_003096 [Chrysophaeum taylorii]